MNPLEKLEFVRNHGNSRKKGPSRQPEGKTDTARTNTPEKESAEEILGRVLQRALRPGEPRTKDLRGVKPESEKITPTNFDQMVGIRLGTWVEQVIAYLTRTGIWNVGLLLNHLAIGTTQRAVIENQIYAINERRGPEDQKTSRRRLAALKLEAGSTPWEGRIV